MWRNTFRLSSLLVLFSALTACQDKLRAPAQGDLVEEGAGQPSAGQRPGTTGKLQRQLEQLLGTKLQRAAGRSRSQTPHAFRYAGGIIAVGVDRHGDGQRLTVSIAGVSLNKLTGIAFLRGQISGAGTIDQYADPSRREGKLKLRCTTCTFGGPKVTLDNRTDPAISFPVTVPILAVGRFTCTLLIAERRLILSDCASRSSEVEFALTGRAKLASPLGRSKLSATLRIKLSERLKASKPKWRAIESAVVRSPMTGSIDLTFRGALSSLRFWPKQAKRVRPPDALPTGSTMATPPVVSAKAIKQLGPRRYAVDFDALGVFLSHPDALQRSATLQPVVRNGEPAGFQLAAVKGGSPVARLGLKSGDVIVRLNGAGTDSIVQAQQAFKGIKSARTVTLTILRGGHRVVLAYKRLPK